MSGALDLRAAETNLGTAQGAHRAIPRPATPGPGQPGTAGPGHPTKADQPRHPHRSVQRRRHPGPRRPRPHRPRPRQPPSTQPGAPGVDQQRRHRPERRRLDHPARPPTNPMRHQRLSLNSASTSPPPKPATPAPTSSCATRSKLTPENARTYQPCRESRGCTTATKGDGPRSGGAVSHAGTCPAGTTSVSS